MKQQSKDVQIEFNMRLTQVLYIASRVCMDSQIYVSMHNNFWLFVGVFWGKGWVLSRAIYLFFNPGLTFAIFLNCIMLTLFECYRL